MHIVSDVKSLNQLLESSIVKNKKVGFVPTMGALHEGHLSLIELAKSECEVVICSIFINPTQFNDSNDLKNYPITMERDIALLESKNCNILFAPKTEDMYPEGVKSMSYNLDRLDIVLEGSKRPGHFDGVCTIVHRLFDCIKPSVAFFGEKDFQQLAIIRQLVKSLKIPVEIKSGPTIREKDGLAKSSRNALLSSEQRKKAAILYRSLKKAKSLFGTVNNDEIINILNEDIVTISEATVDYIEIVNSKTLQPLKKQQSDTEAIALIAVFIGNVRLIDNLLLND